ncbi:signal recognition particle-docking protein FtsY [Methanomethylovorans hollandica DSM 15978]|uniref:Signal recognition particle receptor FtsY n=1 Tax=Methanomethylovorans hollandica (strain DSM 15978 / NBRC 107637 / DMS1) TaxID=867904 RepID=L0KYN4_METHD|nr:signal recognition particle-docking protein FtsY [Methanomethylovorans hollandica]AGB49104.1 signal recognition particle-docking protein FtsY [Methanomethylovorans hollandica DSM 15978]
MFNKLKEKLSGFTKSLGKQIDEKAIPVEPAQEEESEIDFISPSTPETEEQLLSGVATEIVNDEVEPQKTIVSDQTTDTKDIDAKASKSPEQKKTGLVSKAKALVFEREFILDEKDLEEPLWDLQIALLESDIALTVAEAITEEVKSELVGSRRKIGKDTTDIVEQALRNALYNVMSANIFDLDDYVRNARKPVHMVFVGINGTGKTTSIAKTAKRFKDMGYSVVLAAGDTFRAGAIDQLQIHGDRVGVKVIRHQEGGDPAAVVYDAIQYAKAHRADIVLSDTAGRMHTNLNLMEQLKKVCRVSTPDLIIFVDEAVAGNDAVERAAQFNEAVPINGSILTKTDADAKGGAAISIAYITGKPILFLGMGQGYDDLQKFDPKWFVDQIFE